MRTATTTPGDPGVPPLRQPGAVSGGLIAVIVLLLIAVAGVTAGVLLDRTVLRPRARAAWVAGRGFAPRMMTTADRQRRQDALAQALGLSGRQRGQVDSIMRDDMEKFRALQEQMRPRMDSQFRASREALQRVLTPVQFQKLESMRPPGRRRLAPGAAGPGGFGGPPPR